MFNIAADIGRDHELCTGARVVDNKFGTAPLRLPGLEPQRVFCHLSLTGPLLGEYSLYEN